MQLDPSPTCSVLQDADPWGLQQLARSPVCWFLVEFSQLMVLTGTRPAATLLSCSDVLELLTSSGCVLPTPTLRSVTSPWGLGIRYDGSVYTTGTNKQYKWGILTTEPIVKPLPTHHWLCSLTEDTAPVRNLLWLKLSRAPGTCFPHFSLQA